MNFFKDIMLWTSRALIIIGLYFLFTGKLIHAGIIVVTFILFTFIKNNQGHLLLAINLMIKDMKVGIKSFLFKGTPIRLLIVWYIFFAIINNFVIEPITTLSQRIPYGAVSKIPEGYNGIWKNSEYDGGIISKLTIKNGEMTYEFMEEGYEETKQKVKCGLPEIYYSFSLLEYKYGYKFWYKIILIVLPLIPETLFGSQYIYWSCANYNELAYLILTEPSTDYSDFSNKVGVELYDPYIYNQRKEFFSTIFVKKN